MEIDFEKQLKQYGFTKQGQQLDNVIICYGYSHRYC